MRTLQALVATQGDRFVLMQGDIVNAYGQVDRKSVQEAALTECPAVAPILACQWSGVTEEGDTVMSEHSESRGVAGQLPQ